MAASLTSRAANADPTTGGAQRAEGCAGESPAAPVVELSDALNGVAHELSRGGQLSDAIDRIGYPAASSTALYVKSPTDDDAIREIIEDRYCTAVSHPPFTEVGVYRSGNEAWIVFAARAEPPAVEDSATVAARVLDLVNDAREESRRCGRRRFDAVPPLTLSRALTEAAARHARDMALQGSFDHRGSDGSQPAERLSRAGYRWRATGENIAAGQSNADAVVAAWLDSPGHCTNIMGPQFKEMGVAFAQAPSGSRVIYWAQEFAAPQ
ncbi:MAG TPA: CAP domain-containing protein [Vicinamibacterales bacterium]|nr:CAP domain-containing protein [Vicinamibacterales bacterium]